MLEIVCSLVQFQNIEPLFSNEIKLQLVTETRFSQSTNIFTVFADFLKSKLLTLFKLIHPLNIENESIAFGIANPFITDKLAQFSNIIVVNLTFEKSNIEGISVNCELANFIFKAPTSIFVGIVPTNLSPFT